MIDLEEIDKTNALWNQYPNIPLVFEEDTIDFSDNDWTVGYFCRLDLFEGMKSSGKSIVCPEIITFKGVKNEER